MFANFKTLPATEAPLKSDESLFVIAQNFNLLVVLGPTASGKTRLAVGLAQKLGGEIISADSRQVYRGMDIGTGKDLDEYGDVPYHLIDILDPGEEFSVFAFQRRFVQAFESIRDRRKLPVLAGGTGLYLDAVLKGYGLVEVPENPRLRAELADLSMEELEGRLRKLRPQLHNTTDCDDRTRLVRAIEIAEGESAMEPIPLPPITPCIFGIRWERQTLRQRITKRLRQRLEAGMVEEVERLHRYGTSWETLEFYGLEYRFVSRYLRGELNRNDMFQGLNSAIHQFAKRQETWFRRMERQGTQIVWLDGERDLLDEAFRHLGVR